VRWADHLSGGVLPNVVTHIVIVKPRTTKAFCAKGGGGDHGEYYVYVFSLSCTLPFCGLRTFSENDRSSKAYSNSITCPDVGPVKLFICSFILLQEIQLSPLAQ
jgi:hypothetical protein